MPCYSPFMVEQSKAAPHPIPVPCGKCPHCLNTRMAHWAFRLMEEDKVSSSSLFVTLTYDTTKVPISNKGFMTLDKRDVQLWMKRLRKAHVMGQTPLKYYACGEYGSKSMRPHYHVILFNSKRDLLAETWGLGDIHVGDVSGASIAYTLKYINKEKKIPLHANDDRLKEFSLMSKGLGKVTSSQSRSVGILPTLREVHSLSQMVSRLQYPNTLETRSLQERLKQTMKDFQGFE